MTTVEVKARFDAIGHRVTLSCVVPASEGDTVHAWLNLVGRQMQLELQARMRSVCEDLVMYGAAQIEFSIPTERTMAVPAGDLAVLLACVPSSAGRPAIARQVERCVGDFEGFKLVATTTEKEVGD